VAVSGKEAAAKASADPVLAKNATVPLTTLAKGHLRETKTPSAWYKFPQGPLHRDNVGACEEEAMIGQNLGEEEKG
jgi:hypothetical protein